MSEIKSNFRINLDLFELATFGTNYGLQTVNETMLPESGSAVFCPIGGEALS